MTDKHTKWAQEALHALISRASENGSVLSEQDAEPFVANVKAMKALFGASSHPETDIAALLRSTHPIEPEVREALARALEGSGPIRFNREGMSFGKGIRGRQLLDNNLARGRSAILRMTHQKYDAAISETARENGVSDKTVEAHVAFARKVDAWIDLAVGNNENLRRYLLAIERVYLDAFHQNDDPDLMLEQLIAQLAIRKPTNFVID